MACDHLAPADCIMLTAPNPNLDRTHDVGARFGVFARASHDEHQSLMNRGGIEISGVVAGFKVAKYRKFLLDANQLTVLNA